MKERSLWRMTAAVCIACSLLSSCTDKDNPVTGPDTPEVDYQERLVPVIDPQGKAQGTVTLRFYSDMPSVAYVSISNFHRGAGVGSVISFIETKSEEAGTINLFDYLEKKTTN